MKRGSVSGGSVSERVSRIRIIEPDGPRLVPGFRSLSLQFVVDKRFLCTLEVTSAHPSPTSIVQQTLPVIVQLSGPPSVDKLQDYFA